MNKTRTQDSKKAPLPKDVDTYLARLPKKTRAMLERLRRTIRAAAPMAKEVISYRMPAYMYHGPVAFFAAFRDHCSFFPANRTTQKTFARELKPFEVSGTTIHFTVEHPLPATLVRRIVKAKVAQNEKEWRAKLAKSMAKSQEQKAETTRRQQKAKQGYNSQ
jgi:uncharacterized protein YdhG (YjbR/CyaY superfamily)